jgi:predicted N-acetyltransferase YhbS
MRSLGNGLILRCAEESDAERLIDHAKAVFEPTDVPFLHRLTTLHRGFRYSDSFVVADKHSNRIVSFLCLVRYVCVLRGIELQVGQMEMVGTLPDYRHRGLVRALNAAFEDRVTEYGLDLLIIAGIPYFYRTFGYEYAIPLGGNLAVPAEAIPALKKGEKELVHIERVTEQTFPVYLECRQKRNSYLDLYRKVDPEDYPYYAAGDLGEECALEHHLVTQANRPIGSFNLAVAWGNLEIRELWLEDINHLPSVLRFVKVVAQKRQLPLHVEPPSRDALIPYLERLSGSKFTKPYCWYTRIPSIRKFLETLRPVMETRLAESEFRGLTDTLRLSLYREGFSIVFRDGNISEIREVRRQDLRDMHVAVPPLVVNQLLLGYRSFAELSQIYPDVLANAVKVPLMGVLFPKLRTNLMPEA